MVWSVIIAALGQSRVSMCQHDRAHFLNWYFDHAGYEASAQYAEETRRAAKVVPLAMVSSVIVTALGGCLYIAAILFSVQACLSACSS